MSGLSLRFIKQWDIDVDVNPIRITWLTRETQEALQRAELSGLSPLVNFAPTEWFEHHMRGLNRTVILNGHPTMDY